MEFCKMKNCSTEFKPEISAQRLASREQSREARKIFQKFQRLSGSNREPRVCVWVATYFFQNSKNFSFTNSRAVSFSTTHDKKFSNLPETFFKMHNLQVLPK